ncbi:transposase [Caerostris darwini]|uniref:Transposase n=1 Tax=Caerostris darwini TaxID=1538125 RepID=A0AAV4T290_9ARAC|nr:transposase [Caerostris darwini]
MMRPVSRPLLIQIIIAQHVRLQRSSMYPICVLKKNQLGYGKEPDLWIPHQFKEIHLTQRISNCDSLLKSLQMDPFLKGLITDNKKWIVCINVNLKRSWMMHDEPAQTTAIAEVMLPV